MRCLEKHLLSRKGYCIMVKLSIEKGLEGLESNGIGASDQDEMIIAEKATSLFAF
ncbi:MAG: hypothetical protein NTY64_14300 [Deltaproteobacteria bacterium]|nr:hypothetical protein [Deltaproteobacteria bacterium]